MTAPALPFRHQHDAEILRLAVPAFGALVAEPIFLLTDSAIIGHLGTSELAGVGVAATILGTVISLSVFLAYGTTAAVARMIGADDLAGALRRGIDGLWLALIVGLLIAGAGLLLAPWLVGLFGTTDAASGFAVTYLRVSLIGLPGMLVVLAMTGVLRGLQDTRTPLVVSVAAAVINIFLSLLLVWGLGLGVGGAALGTVLVQWGSAVAYVVVVLRGTRQTAVRLLPSWAGVLGSLTASAPLLVRTISLRLVFLFSAATVAGMGPEQLAAHQVALTIWTALGLGLDAVAIAGQALVGRYLGAGDVSGARLATRRMVEWAIGVGVVFMLFLIASHSLLPALFSPDPRVQDYLAGVLLVMAILQPPTGWAFALDGVLIGAGDARFLAIGQAATLLVFLPLLGVVWVSGAGLSALWLAIGGWVLARVVMLVYRERSDGWMIVGATR